MLKIKTSYFFLCIRPLPDIDTLLQEWSPDVEDALKEEGIPPAELDCDLSTYVDIACGSVYILCSDHSFQC